MSSTDKNAKKNVSKRETEILIGIALIILAMVFVYFAVSQPSDSRNKDTTVNSVITQHVEASDLFVDEPAETTQAEQTNDNTTKAGSVVQTSAKSTQATTDATTAAPTQEPTQDTTKSSTQATTQTTTTQTITQTTTQATATTQAATSPVVTITYPLNLNTCTAAELMTIDGIGEVRAASIIAYREYLGGYTDVEQLKNISGIGDGIFAKIEPYVTV